ncbi:uncharacterized protein TNIN_482401 [Trichonephila inaurata madagascariensis]|uniref:Uncharacterized protein n=1 Tax=Trichonephila inaurata madagascariensis TaxID=2747483 RepID=A0A8X7BT48_9ARAC|nr:uncharacterized protein TNIN_482401 [Trichonephila inaurata madagascariensis]
MGVYTYIATNIVGTATTHCKVGASAQIEISLKLVFLSPLPKSSIQVNYKPNITFSIVPDWKITHNSIQKQQSRGKYIKEKVRTVAMIQFPVQVLVLSVVAVSSVIALKGYSDEFINFNVKADICIGNSGDQDRCDSLLACEKPLPKSIDDVFRTCIKENYPGGKLNDCTDSSNLFGTTEQFDSYLQCFLDKLPEYDKEEVRGVTMARFAIQVLVLSVIAVSSVIALKGYSDDFINFNVKANICIGNYDVFRSCIQENYPGGKLNDCTDSSNLFGTSEQFQSYLQCFLNKLPEKSSLSDDEKKQFKQYKKCVHKVGKKCFKERGFKIRFTLKH